MPIELQGKYYKLVAERLVVFFDEFQSKGFRINTQHDISNGAVVMHAAIIDNDGVTVSTGHARRELDTTKALEKCETNAVGRALAFLDKDLMGSEIASADEVSEAIILEAEQKHIDYMGLVRDCWESIAQAKTFLLPVYGEHEDQPNVSAAREVLKELGEETYMKLWKAPSKGGVFTTHERTILKVKPEESL